jgi:FOG: HEAT repeat
MSITPESVEQLLNSEDFGDRLRAVNQLRQLEPAIAYNLIQSAIGDKNVRVRYAAVSQMSTLGTQNLSNALEVLLHSLRNDPEPDVQAAAADALGALKLTDALEDLQQVYSSTSEWLVQLSIVAALGEMGDPKAFPMLENALTSENELIQTIAMCTRGIGRQTGDRTAYPLRRKPRLANSLQSRPSSKTVGRCRSRGYSRNSRQRRGRANCSGSKRHLLTSLFAVSYNQHKYSSGRC